MSTSSGESVPAAGRRMSLLGRYMVIGPVGEGGAGWVLAAYDPELDRKVAIKVLRPGTSPLSSERQSELETRLVREARAIARLSHPNVVAIYDVGTHEGQIFLAMEYLGGGTLRRWMATRSRPVTEIRDTFLNVGRGLVAAHAQGFIHRDFKPENVLFDQQGAPKVVDFGLVRLRAQEPTDDGGAPRLPSDTPPPAGGTTGPAERAAEALTRTGSLAGTPAYMAPEQHLGRVVDARADQFAFAVTLYEALCGRRPFAGESALQIAASMVEGQVPEFPRDTAVPAYLKKAVLKGLAPAPDDRHRSMAAFLDALARDPRARLRRRVATGGVALLGLLAVVGSVGFGLSRHRRFEATLGDRVDRARAHLAEATAAADRLAAAQARSFHLFDEGQRQQAESRWARDLAETRKVRQSFERASQQAEDAFLMDPSRAETRALLGDALLACALFERRQTGRVDAALSERLARYDPDHQRLGRLEAVALLSIDARPATARVTIEAFERGGDSDQGRYRALRSDLSLPLTGLTLAPGSYRLNFTSGGHADLSLPLSLSPGAKLSVRPTLPAIGAIPADFVPVSAGEFWVGSAEPEEIRRELQAAVPFHPRNQAGFLIKRHETTYREWIAYLEALPPGERTRRTPRSASMGFQGSVTLRRMPEGWELSLRPSTHTIVVRQGQRVAYPHRKQRVEQDWLDFPVNGVGTADAQAYALWLATSDRVRGARLCTDEEWEHAARGADGRPYPHGWRLEPGDANFAATWDHEPRAYGPDVVGSYPRSRSPYGVDDMAGNVWEWVTARDGAGRQVARGGAFAFDAVACRTEVREISEADLRNVTAGVRICADWTE